MASRQSSEAKIRPRAPRIADAERATVDRPACRPTYMSPPACIMKSRRPRARAAQRRGRPRSPCRCRRGGRASPCGGGTPCRADSIELDGLVVNQRQPLRAPRPAWESIVLIVIELPEVRRAPRTSRRTSRRSSRRPGARRQDLEDLRADARPARCRRHGSAAAMSLPSRQMLISDSSRSNSAKTSSNAAIAAASSAVHAVSRSSEPIVTRARSTLAGGAAGSDAPHAAR